MKEREISLGQMFEFATLNLPPGWELSLTMTQAGVDLMVHDPDGESPDVCLDDMETDQAIEAYVNHARKAEGWSPARFAEH